MRIGIEYTSAMQQGAGVGRYTRSLTAALAELADTQCADLILWYTGRTSRASAALTRLSAHPSITIRRVPISDRWLTIGWQRLHLPIKLEWLIGQADIAHSPDFVAPPSSIPTVVTVHDLSYRITPEFAYPKLRHYLDQAVPRSVSMATKVIVPSVATHAALVDHYRTDPSKIAVIPHGVDTEFSVPNRNEIDAVRTKLGLPERYFITVGTVEPRKNHLALLTAFEQVHAVHDEIGLVIVGRPGWLSEPIMKEIHRSASRRPVFHLQHVEDALLPALYAGSMAMVYPSWYEGFGMPVLEAMACGTAAIVSDRGSLPEVTGNAALTIAPDQPEALANAMLRILEDTTLRARLIADGKVHSARFRWSDSALQHLAIYRQAGAMR